MATDDLLRAVRHRDPRFDGWFVTGVRSTHIYCRPSCPALPMRADRLEFFPTSAAAQRQGYRACKRCRPDATPGSPAWNTRGDLVARAMRLIADGVVDRDGVTGLAVRLGYSERHVHRLLMAEVGAGPLALARSQRATTARTLIETTDLPLTEVAFAAGFGSVRQFNDTVRAVFAASPSQLRCSRSRDTLVAGTSLRLRLPARAPFDGASLLSFLRARAVAGIEGGDDGAYVRSFRLPSGPGVVSLRAGPGTHVVEAELRLADLRDLAAAVQRCRRLLDLDADPRAIGEVLGADQYLAPMVHARPGLRSPGAVDAHEQAIRAVLGQQVSVAAARTLTAHLVEAWGEDLPVQLRDPGGSGPTRLFPSMEVLADADLDELPLTRRRRATLRVLARAVAEGDLALDVGADRVATQAQLLSLPGIGPWTAGYIAMRGLGDPDVLLASDLGVRRALENAGGPHRPTDILERGRRWSPWRSYALHHLWASLHNAQLDERIDT